MLNKREPVYQALWAGPCDFDEVLISPVMIQDHMPDNMLKALNKVSETDPTIGEIKRSQTPVTRIPSVRTGNYELLEETTEVPELTRKTDESRNNVVPVGVQDNGHVRDCGTDDTQVRISTIYITEIVVANVEVHEREDTRAEPRAHDAVTLEIGDR